MTGFISRVFVNLIVSLAGICELIFSKLLCARDRIKTISTSFQT